MYLIYLFLTMFSINWYTPNVGIPLAKSTNKQFMIYYHTDWCGYCKRMEKTVFNDTSIHLDTNMIPISINCDRNDTITVKGKVRTYREFCNEMGVHAYPAFKWFSPKGKTTKSYIGAMNLREFKKENGQ